MANAPKHQRISTGLPQQTARPGWAEAFARMAAAKDDLLELGPGQTGTKFDVTEWALARNTAETLWEEP